MCGLMALYFCSMFTCEVYAQQPQEPQREPMDMSVVIVNPSDTKIQTVPIKMYLPEEVTPDAILDAAGLDVEYDSEKSMYFVYKEAVKLKPSETKTFEIEIKDVWIIPQGRLDSLANQVRSIIERLVGSEFHDAAERLANTIYKSLDAITLTQNDEAVSKRSHIGIYRNNLKIVDQVKDDIVRLEKQLEIVMSRPKPEVLETDELKTETPEDSTTWMIIFIIMIFIGMLAGVFFFTWHAQANATKEMLNESRQEAFPEQEHDEASEEGTE